MARATCSGCHAFPPPDILPRDRWRDEFVRMTFIRENRLPPIGAPETVYKSVQLPPDFTQVLSYYVARAPERLPAPDAWPDPAESPIRFARHSLAVTRHARTTGGLARLPGGLRRRQSSRRARHGHASGRRLQRSALGGRRRCRSSPAFRIPRTRPTSTSTATAFRDLLVGDMGAFFPADHKKGAVIWLRGLGKGKFSARSGSTTGRASPMSRRRTSTTTARTILPLRRSGGARPGT